MNTQEKIDNQLKKLGVRRRSINNPFFHRAHNYCQVFERKGVTDEDYEELYHELMKQFSCNACIASFDNLLDYELHYHDSHQFVCIECNKWEPTARLLEIHIQETHDSYFQVIAEKQPMYQCFVSECDVKFKDPVERTGHCREVHAFTKNFLIDQLNKSKSKLANQNELPMETNKTDSSIKRKNNETPLETNETESSAKKKRKLYFDNNHQKTFNTRQNFEIAKPTAATTFNPKLEKKMAPVTMFIPRQVQQKSFAKTLTKNKQMEANVLESESIMDLGDSLPSID